MTNEELALLVQAGERERLTELWDGVEKFILLQAVSRARQLNGRGGVTWEDLYQSGFFAVVAAADTYRSDQGASFVSWLSYYLKTAFARASGHYGSKKDALNYSLDIDAPLPGTEDLTLADTLEDPGAAQSFEDAEQMVWSEQLHSALESALDGLSNEQSDIIRRRFYQRQALADVAEETGRTITSVRQSEVNAMRAIRRPSRRRQYLQAFLL